MGVYDFIARYQHLERLCPICGKLVQAKFYDYACKAWRFKHQRATPSQGGNRKSLKRETYYCESKAAG